jgi:RsiW-degrading membrane proteinase PrsW (M82 family)/ribosomal protein L40E
MSLIVLSFLLSVTFWLWIILKYDRFEREPLKTVIPVMILGGFGSTVIAGLFNHLLIQSLFSGNPGRLGQIGLINNRMILYGILGINEEFWKAMATILLIRRLKQFNEPADALVYSMTVALGFSVFENIEYTLKLGLLGFIIRQFNAVPLHIGLSAVWGIGIAKARFLRGGKYFRTVLPLVLLAGIIHGTYNLSAIQFPMVILNIFVPCIFAFLLIRFAIRKIKRYSEDGPFSTRLFCHHCGTVNFPDAKRCKKCGQNFQLDFYSLCAGCNARVPKNAELCPGCGKELARKVDPSPIG